MTRAVDAIAELIAESRGLEDAARGVQGERALLMEASEINNLVEQYHAWFARALGVLPETFHDRFREEYKGNWHSHKVKHFFEGPGEINMLWSDDPSRGPSPFPHWQYPYDTTFRGPLLAQRQILSEAQEQLRGGGYNEDVELVERICRGFSEFLAPLRSRQRSRSPIVMEDEYDVQDFLHGLLRIFFDDVRPEDFSPERAGGRSRVDFVLKSERIVVEAKMTRAGLGARKVGEELILDIERYRSHPDCGAIVALIYDPDRRISNRRGLEADLSGEREGLAVRVVVTQ